MQYLAGSIYCCACASKRETIFSWTMDKSIYNCYQLSKAKGFKMVYLNIRSLPQKLYQLRAILQASNRDVITKSDTWLHSKVDSQMIDIQGYTAYRLDRETQNAELKQKRGGGLITYIKNGSMDVYVQNTENVSTKDIEVQWLKIKRENTKTILLAII